MSTRPKNPNLVQSREDQDDDINFDGTMVNKVSPLDEAFSERTVVMPRSQAPDYMPPTPRLGSVPPPTPVQAPVTAPAAAPTPPPTFVAKFEAVKVPPAPTPQPAPARQEMFSDDDVTAPGRAPQVVASFTPPFTPPPMPSPMASAPPVSPIPKPAASAQMNQWQSAPAVSSVEEDAPKAPPAAGGWRDALLKNQEELKLEPQLTPPPPHPMPERPMSERPNSGGMKMPASLQPYVAPAGATMAVPKPAPETESFSAHPDEDTDFLPLEEAPKANRFAGVSEKLRGVASTAWNHPSLDRFKALPRFAQVGIVGFSFLVLIVLVKSLGSSPEVAPVAAPVVQKPVVEEAPVVAAAPKVVHPGTGPDAVLSQFDAAFFKTQSQARDGL